MPVADLKFLPLPATSSYDSTVVVPSRDTHSSPFWQVSLASHRRRRLEERIPLAVRVDLCSLDLRHRADEALTENVSSHGAPRVVSSNPVENCRIG